jgi:hypothetical protein
VMLRLHCLRAKGSGRSAPVSRQLKNHADHQPFRQYPA